MNDDNPPPEGFESWPEFFASQKTQKVKEEEAKLREPTTPAAPMDNLNDSTLKTEIRNYLNQADALKADSGEGGYLHGETRTGSRITFHVRSWQETGSNTWKTAIAVGNGKETRAGTVAQWGSKAPSAQEILTYYKTWSGVKVQKSTTADPYDTSIGSKINLNNKGDKGKKKQG